MASAKKLPNRDSQNYTKKTVNEHIEGFGERLKDLRLQRDLTMDMVVSDMSHEFTIELTKGNLSRWENGVNYPSLRMAAYLAAYYKVSLDYLIGNTDVKTPVDLLTTRKRLNSLIKGGSDHGISKEAPKRRMENSGEEDR